MTHPVGCFQLNGLFSTSAWSFIHDQVYLDLATQGVYARTVDASFYDSLGMGYYILSRLLHLNSPLSISTLAQVHRVAAFPVLFMEDQHRGWQGSSTA